MEKPLSLGGWGGGDRSRLYPHPPPAPSTSSPAHPTLPTPLQLPYLSPHLKPCPSGLHQTLAPVTQPPIRLPHSSTAERGQGIAVKRERRETADTVSPSSCLSLRLSLPPFPAATLLASSSASARLPFPQL